MNEQTPQDDGKPAVGWSDSNAGLGLHDRISAHLRQLAPHMVQRDGVVLLREARDEIERLQKGLAAAAQLMDESSGVTGLHLNGDIAPWGELRTGGRYEEWLVDFDAALMPNNGDNSADAKRQSDPNVES